MKPLRPFLLFAGLLFTATGSMAATNQGDADSQLWSETRLVYKLDDKFDIFTAGSYRLTKDFTDFSRVAARFGGSWAATPAFTVTPSYFYRVNSPWTTAPQPESRACLLLTYAIPVKTALLTLANTTEYRWPQNSKLDAFWLRPRIRIAHPIGPSSWRLNAFVADELFYNNGREVFTQDQVFAGFEKKFNDTFTTSLYYCRRIQMNSNAVNANVICIDFRITFGRKSDSPPEVQLR